MAHINPCFAYYCSGHGYGHATRVSAFACHLLSLEPTPTVYIVSSAPKHVFSDSISAGARYRYADIDPVIVQPIAYRVDRQKSFAVLKDFLQRKDVILEKERAWLAEICADCVLSDAAFLGCLAANTAGLPCALITNFTFDSVYSYLSTSFKDQPAVFQAIQSPSDNSLSLEDFVPDIPIPDSELKPLVQQIYDGYRCADLLILLPGCIPIPSFAQNVALPSPSWTDQSTNTLRQDIIAHLIQSPSIYTLHPPIPFSDTSFSLQTKAKPLPRSIIQAPLLVRCPSESSSVYTPEGRSRLLSSIGIPPHLHDPDKTKILIVSFGGQVFRKPSSRSSSGDKTPSRASHTRSPGTPVNGTFAEAHSGGPRVPPVSKLREDEACHLVNGSPRSKRASLPSLIIPLAMEVEDSPITMSPRLATTSHLFIPGAPPASKPSPTTPSTVCSILTESMTSMSVSDHDWNDEKSSNVTSYSYFDAIITELDGPRLLPDESWIAVVCGVSKEQWSVEGGNEEDGLPEGFYVAPKDVYMPDLTAAADVLLGKLGYGTVSECVDSCTPFVFVSRPLFVEEHGLRLLLDRDGVGIELSRVSYEAGDWGSAVEKAWYLGRRAKSIRRKRAALGIGLEQRREEGRELAEKVVDWTKLWHGSSTDS